MRPRKRRGEGTVAESGRYATHGERKRASVVAAAMASIEPGSAVSGATSSAGAVWALAGGTARTHNMAVAAIAPGTRASFMAAESTAIRSRPGRRHRVGSGQAMTTRAPRSIVRRSVAWAALLAWPLAAAPPPALAGDDTFGDVARLVAVGDVHGDLAQLVTVLQDAGVVDAKQRWVGGKTHLIQTGDRVDRGADSRAVMDLFIRLEKEARKAGGAVHCLLGNHEAMNMLG